MLYEFGFGSLHFCLPSVCLTPAIVAYMHVVGQLFYMHCLGLSFRVIQCGSCRRWDVGAAIIAITMPQTILGQHVVIKQQGVVQRQRR